MDPKHKVTINVTNPGGIRSPVVKGNRKSIRSRLLERLFGEKVGVLVITPGDSVETVEIKEIRKGGEEDGKKDTA